MLPSYLIGSVVRISVSISDSGTDALTDPGTLSLKVRPPATALYSLVYGVDSEIVKDAAGTYHADIVLDKAGAWRWRWEASAPTGVVEGEVTVQPSRVT